MSTRNQDVWKQPNQISYWDEKAKCFGVDTKEIRDNAGIVSIGDELDPVSMKNCPNWLEYMVLNIVKPKNQVPVDLYKVNMNLCRVCALGRCNFLHRKSNGLSWSCMSVTRMVDEPYCTCAVFNLKLGLGKLLLIGMREFYLEVARIVDDFEVTKNKNNHELCLYIEWKNQKDSNECEILEGHKLHNPKFNRHLKIVHMIQKLNWSWLSVQKLEGGISFFL